MQERTEPIGQLGRPVIIVETVTDGMPDDLLKVTLPFSLAHARVWIAAWAENRNRERRTHPFAK